MDTNTSPAKNSAFVVYVQNYDESENDIDHLGAFATFQDAVDFRKDFLVKDFDDCADLSDEELDEVFEEEFHGNVRDWVLDDGHQQYIIEEVPVYSK